MTAQRVEENKAVFAELSVGFLKFEDRAQASQTKQTKDRHEQFYCGLRAKNSNRPIKIGYFHVINQKRVRVFDRGIQTPRNR